MSKPFRHPLAAHAAGTVLGYRRDGRPIYVIAGGDKTGDGGQEGNPSGQGGQDPNPPASTPPSQQQPADGDETSLPAWAQKALKDARAEAAKSRTVAKQNAAQEAEQRLVQQIGRTLGLIKDDEEADPAQLTQQLADSQRQARQTAVDLAAYKAAGAEGARADRLLNSRSFGDRLAQLDPAAADFGDQLAAAIRAEVDTDPDLYKATPTGPARGGTEFNGSPAAERRPANLRDAIAARLGG